MKRLALSAFILVAASTARADTPSYMWAHSTGHVVSDHIASVATDASNNVFISGDFYGTIGLGGDSLTSYYYFGSIKLGSHDIFTAKYDANGNHLWSRRDGGQDVEASQAMTVDPSGDVITAGQFWPPASFGGATFTTGTLFLAKYSGTNGAPVWSLSTGISGGGSSRAWITDLACDASGNIFVIGYFQGTMNIGGTNLVSLGSYDIFVAKFTSAGSTSWVSRYGEGSGADSGEDIAIDTGGNVIITGRYYNAIDFGGGTIWGGTIFLVKLTNAGAHVWSKGMGGSGVGLGVAVDAANNIVLTGYYSGSFNFGGGYIPGSGQDVFLARYDGSGNHLWSKGFQGVGGNEGKSVAIDGSGNIALTGYFGYVFGAIGYTIDFDGTVLSSVGEGDGFLAMFSSAGVLQRATRFGGHLLDSGEEVAMDQSGNATVVGSFLSSIQFLAQTFPSRGLEDVFVAKFAAAAAEPDILSITDVGNDQGRSVKVSFASSGLDGVGRSVPVIRYDAYRRDDPAPAAAQAPRGTLDMGWQYVASVPAHGESQYLMRAPTLGDSTETDGMYRSVFFVRAVTEDEVYSFFDSPPDSGYSLDNLAPGVPLNFVYSAGQLSWDESSATDFDYFTVYGSNTDSFGAATAVDYSVAPAMDVTASPYVFYFVTATDFSGNEGQPARVNTLSGAGGTPRRYALSVSNFPNPFNPRTTVRYTVPSRGAVTVAIYDARGARVATLVDNGERAAGAYTLEWDGRAENGAVVSSGIYFARIEHAGSTRTKKMVLLK